MLVADPKELARTVTARLGYLDRTTERPYDYAYPPPAGMPWQNYEQDERPVSIADARMLQPPPMLHREGFTLCNAPTCVTDFLDDDAIRRVYYAEAAELARAATGAKAAYVFDHLVRKRAPQAVLSFGRQVKGERPSANGRVHNDYTELSGPRRMAQVLEDTGAQIGRYAIVNIWRPIKGPVLDAPLALCDARSVSVTDLVASDVHYATRSGEIYLARHSPRHRWFYFPRMEQHEALVFKQYDSDPSAPRFVPHAAFDDPTTPIGTPPRESIEVRCLLVFD
jgi:hypothetical protein